MDSKENKEYLIFSRNKKVYDLDVEKGKFVIPNKERFDDITCALCGCDNIPVNEEYWYMDSYYNGQKLNWKQGFRHFICGCCKKRLKKVQ